VQQLVKVPFRALAPIVWPIILVVAVASIGCAEYKVVVSDGGGEHVGSGGGAGFMAGGVAGATTTGVGGAAGSTTAGLGGAAGLGGNGGSLTALDGSAQDSPRDVAAEKSESDAPGDTGPPLLANGVPCSAGTQCQSMNCVDSVCCDTACSGQCQACGEATARGTCVTVTGAVRGAIRPTCSGTGACVASCNGADPSRCYFPGSDKQCAAPSCSSGVARAAASCDGAGNCVGATNNCDPFACGATACKTTCTGPADCTNTNYCSGTSCVSKKALGAVCASPDQCSSSICGGRCCSAPCTCPQQSAANVLTNPGFDSSVSGWNNPAIASQWTGQDVDGCPFSGSFLVMGSGLGLAQCVAVTPGANYIFSGWFRNPNGTPYIASFAGASDENCLTAAAAPTAGDLSGTETNWTFRSTIVSVPSTTNHIRIEIDTNSGLFVDKLSLSINGGF
jgi:hypothetical protein